MSFLETAVVIGHDLQPMHWHEPPGRTAVSIPHDFDFWEYIWENRKDIMGIAHSHPGSGNPAPSMEDLTTFRAIESAIGRKKWWIQTDDEIKEYAWFGPHKFDYASHANWIDDIQMWVPHSFVPLCTPESVSKIGNIERYSGPVLYVPDWVYELREASLLGTTSFIYKGEDDDDRK